MTFLKNGLANNEVRRSKASNPLMCALSPFLQKLWVLSALTVLLPNSFISARPISYPDSWTWMQQYNWEKVQIHGHYSPNSANSIGFLGAYYRDKNERLYALQWNHLLDRKNEKTSQANLYSKVHLGLLNGERVTPSEGNERIHGSVTLSYDWETRKHFFSYSAEAEYEDSSNAFSFHHKARIGIAPYLAPYGKLHTWLMLQLENHPEEADSDNRLIFTPLLRFFKGDILCELGLNSNHQLLFNSIIRF